MQLKGSGDDEILTIQEASPTLQFSYLRKFMFLINWWQLKLLKCSNKSLCLLQIIETRIINNCKGFSVKKGNFSKTLCDIFLYKVYNININERGFNNKEILRFYSRYEDLTVN